MKFTSEWYNAQLAKALTPKRQGVAIESDAPKQGVDKESDLHAAIFDFCRGKGWIPLHGSMANRTSRTLGEPDFVILADAGRTFIVECKSRLGKLSSAQQAMTHHAATLSHTIHEVRSFERFLEIVK